MRVRKNDLVAVMAGKDKGKRGRITISMPREGRVVVEGVNVVKRHMKPKPNMRQAGIVQKEAPIPVTKVMLVCPKCSRLTGVRATFVYEGQVKKKVRVCKRCQETID